jgi:FkbM family methyltransferase
MILRGLVHAAGRLLTRVLLHPRWRDRPPIAWIYLQLYLLGKRLTERHEVSIVRTLVDPGMVIADIGANVGFYTLQMAAAVGRVGRILAFEPDAFNFRQLQRRANKTALGNVDAYQVAVGDCERRATLYSSAYNRADNRLNRSHAEKHVESSDVHVKRLDDFLSVTPHARIDALKIDVQGAEAEVLRGADRTLKTVRWIWIEFSPEHLRGAGQDPESFLERLDALGLDMYQLNESGALERLTDLREYARTMVTRYGDLVLMARDWRKRPSGSNESSHPLGAKASVN